MTTTKSRVQQSLDLYDRAEELIPGKTQLISRRASSFAHPISPIYADHAKGSRFVDVDGNEYIDWVNAVTAIILGHADDVVDGAVREQIDKGSLFTLNSPLEIELAELLIDTIPSAEMVRYTKGGGESCAVAVRIARGTPGRTRYSSPATTAGTTGTSPPTTSSTRFRASFPSRASSLPACRERLRARRFPSSTKTSTTCGSSSRKTKERSRR